MNGLSTGIVLRKHVNTAVLTRIPLLVICLLCTALSACSPTEQGASSTTATSAPRATVTMGRPTPAPATAIPVATVIAERSAVPTRPLVPAATATGATPHLAASAAVVPAAQRRGLDANILVEQPRAGDTVVGTIHVNGKARVFEAALSWALVANGAPVLVGNAMTSGGAPAFGVFRFDIVPPASVRGGDVTVQVFTHSPRDGSVQDLVEVPVQLGTATTLSDRTTRVWFLRNTPSGMTDVSVSRPLPDTAAVASAALQELVRGPSPDEMARGIVAALPAGTQLRNVSINDGTAYVDFTHQLTDGTDTARRQAALHAITLTLKEFSTVRAVVISVEGNPVSS